MTKHVEPTKRQLQAIVADILQQGGGDELENHLFFRLYNRDEGFYGRNNGQPANRWRRGPNGLERKKTRMSRREWIEKFFPIVPKGGGAVQTMKLNPTQRRLEAEILKMERAGIPVRIQILKARQQGCSTYVQAVGFYTVMTGSNKHALIIADTRERSELLLNIMRTGLRNMKRTPDHEWTFAFNRRKLDNVEWSKPISGTMTVTSAEVNEPARGSTPALVHCSETAFWKDGEKKQLGVIDATPRIPETYIFDESTANGDEGPFRDGWYLYSAEKGVPYRERVHAWGTVFFAWYEHPDYRLSKTGRELTPQMQAEIQGSLDEEERWLLKQSYYERGKGWRRVDFDQLAWRRQRMNDKGMAGNEAMFNQEYPSRPDVAFRATGSPVFSYDKLAEYERASVSPRWRGNLQEDSDPGPGLGAIDAA